MIKDHYERLDCGHQNNLLLTGNSPGVCPKGCDKPKVLRTEKIDTELANIEEIAIGD